jgi:hypothetical protein
MDNNPLYKVIREDKRILLAANCVQITRYPRDAAADRDPPPENATPMSVNVIMLEYEPAFWEGTLIRWQVDLCFLLRERIIRNPNSRGDGERRRAGAHYSEEKERATKRKFLSNP